MRFLYIAYGSVCELETQTMISGDLGYVGKERLQEIRQEIGDVERMLKAMIKSLENKHLNPWILDRLDPFSQLIGRRTKNESEDQEMSQFALTDEQKEFSNKILELIMR